MKWVILLKRRKSFDELMDQNQQYRQVMSNNNCLPQCLRGNAQEGQSHLFKMKKGKKCITLAKNIQLNSTLANKMTIKEGNCENRAPKREQIQLKSYVVKRNIRERTRLLTSFENRTTQKSTSPVKSVDSQQISARIIFQPFVMNQHQHQQKIRRLSLDSVPKPIIFSRPIFFQIRNQPTRSISEGKKIVLFKKTSEPQLQPKKSRFDQQYLISPIREVEEQRQKRSSLFQGAKSIVSRLVTSRKVDQILNFGVIQTANKRTKTQVSTFYDNVRLCETQNAITFTNSSIITEQQQKRLQNHNFNSFDSIPMSPHSMKGGSYGNFKIGRLLGVGKWAHVYLCQQRVTGSIYAIKQIFKESLKIKFSADKLIQQMNQLVTLSHNKLINTYAKFETADKICMIVEYCSRNAFEQLREKGFYLLQKVRKYSLDLIEAVVFLHQNQVVHGNINLFQIFINFSQCKLKTSLVSSENDGKDPLLTFKFDIQSLAIVLFQMGHGLVPITVTTDTLYQKQKLYKDVSSRTKILDQIKQMISRDEDSPQLKLFNNLIQMFLDWDQNCILTTSACLNHPFLASELHR